MFRLRFVIASLLMSLALGCSGNDTFEGDETGDESPLPGVELSKVEVFINSYDHFEIAATFQNNSGYDIDMISSHISHIRGTTAIGTFGDSYTDLILAGQTFMLGGTFDDGDTHVAGDCYRIEMTIYYDNGGRAQPEFEECEASFTSTALTR